MFDSDLALSTCRECDTETDINTHGLCNPCNNDLTFVVRPAAHREHSRRNDATSPAIRELERQGVVVFAMTPADNSLWVCDFDNNQIPVTDDITLIPLLGSYALCPNCVSRIPYWPDAWIDPQPRACPCPACQLLLQRARNQDLIQLSLQTNRRTPGLER